jgi:hypothetical protein
MPGKAKKSAKKVAAKAKKVAKKKMLQQEPLGAIQLGVLNPPL